MLWDALSNTAEPASAPHCGQASGPKTITVLKGWWGTCLLTFYERERTPLGIWTPPWGRAPASHFSLIKKKSEDDGHLRSHRMPNRALSSPVLSTLAMASQPAGFIPVCLIGVPASGDSPACSPAAGLGSQSHSLDLASDVSWRTHHLTSPHLTSGHLKGCGQPVYCCQCLPHHHFP